MRSDRTYENQPAAPKGRWWNVNDVVPPAGLEPAALGLEVPCSIHLSYGGGRAECRAASAVASGSDHRRGSFGSAPIGWATIPSGRTLCDAARHAPLAQLVRASDS